MAIRIPYGDDEQFDLAAWFHSCYNRLRCYTSWSVYIFMYFGNSIVNDLMFSSAKISIIPDYAKFFRKKLAAGNGRQLLATK